MARTLLLAVLALLASTVCAYDCPTSSCDNAANCQCASTSPPAGLSPDNVPQFIVLTNDDAVSVVTVPAILNITNHHTNRNGCPMPATWFVSVQYTDPNLIRGLYMAGHEIATHTVNHVGLPNGTEILGAKLFLNQTANVPLEKLRGFRAPFLAHDPTQRTALEQGGFNWDSSMPEQWGTNSASGASGGEKVWPFTMDYGVAINCAVGTGTCSPTETHPGLWEFPLWDIQDDNGQALASMDPVGDFNTLYTREFLRNYNGNRAPLGIYLHAGWLLAQQENQGQLNTFLKWALSHEDVFVVTISQVLDWMKNPVPASEYSPACPVPRDMWLPAGRFCPPPEGGCVQGTWNPASCSCDCLNMYLPASPGFCPDPVAGVCNTVKTWDATSQKWLCPGSPTAPVVRLHPQATPDIGHTPLELTGLQMSGPGDLAQRFALAWAAVDNLTSTCVTVVPTAGLAYLTIVLPVPSRISGVTLLLGNTANGVRVRAGNDTTAGGTQNPICTASSGLPATRPTTLACAATASLVTVTASVQLSICDISLPGLVAAVAPSSGGSTSTSSPATGSSYNDGTQVMPSPSVTSPPSSSSTATSSGAPITSGSGTVASSDMDTAETLQQVADILPITGAMLQFTVTGVSLTEFAASSKATSVCSVLGLLLFNRGLSEDAIASCTITSVTEAPAGRRRLVAAAAPLLITAVIKSSRPAEVEAALQQALADGTLATELRNIGLTLFTTSSTTAAGSGKASTIGAAVGGALGGVALVTLVAAAVVLVRRRRQARAAPAGEHDAEQGLPKSTDAQAGHPQSKLKVAVGGRHLTAIAVAAGNRSRLGEEATASGSSSSTPRLSTAVNRSTPRHPDSQLGV